MNKEFLKKCWKHPRWHSLMVLILWIIVLSVLIGFVSIVNQLSPKKEVEKKVNREENSKVTYEEKWEDILNGNYTFTYLIKKEQETIKYEGSIKENKTTGYRERNDGIIKYEIENNKHFQVLVDEKLEIANLYENINENFISIPYLYELIKNISTNDIKIMKEKEKIIYEYNIEIESENTVVQVTIDDVKIKSITIQNQTEVYNLEFHFD